MRKDGEDMREKIARGAAAGIALLLVLAYIFLPADQESTLINNSGRKKLEMAEGEDYSWDWTPEMEGANGITLHLSGMKKAQEVTLTVKVLDDAGAEAASAEQKIAEMEKGADSIQIRGAFSKGRTYRLSVKALGGGELKLKGELREETEDFYPMLTETASYQTRNNMILYYALGALLASLTPVFGKPDRKKRAEKPELSLPARLLPWGTFFMLASLGIFITAVKPMFVTGEAWNSWDEEVHWAGIQNMSLFTGKGLRGAMEALGTSNLAYLPCAIGYNLGTIFTSNEELLYHLSVGCGCLFYAGICALAVKHAPRYKATFMVAGALPTLLFLATSASYDAPTAACILLGTALTMEIMDQEEKMSSFQAITLISVMAFGTVSKLLYSPILFFALLIPDDRFSRRRNAWIFRVFVLVMFVWCLFSIMVPGISNAVWAGDDRFPDTSTSGQFAYMLQNPIEGGLKPIRWLWENRRVMLISGITHWAYLGLNERLNEIFVWLLLVVAPLCTLGERMNRKSLLTPIRRIFLFGIALGAEILFCYALYLVSSPVGGEVTGMQARYFMPVWGIMALALMWPHRIRQRMGKWGEWMTAAAWLICFAANLQNAIMHMTATGLM